MIVTLTDIPTFLTWLTSLLVGNNPVESILLFVNTAVTTYTIIIVTKVQLLASTPKFKHLGSHSKSFAFAKYLMMTMTMIVMTCRMHR